MKYAPFSELHTAARIKRLVRNRGGRSPQVYWLRGGKRACVRYRNKLGALVRRFGASKDDLEQRLKEQS